MMVLLGLAGFDAARRTPQQRGAGALAKRWLPIATVLLGLTFAAYIAMINAAGEVYATKLPKAVVAALAIVAAAALAPPLFEWAMRRRFDRVLGAALIALTLAYVVGAAYLYARFYASNVRSINGMHVAMGRWVAASVPEDALVAVNDVGGIAYFGRRELLDLTGTVSPEVLPVLLKFGDAVSVSDSGVINVLTEAKPDYVIVFPQWFPTLSSLLSTAGSPTGSCEVARITVVGNTVAGGDTMVVYRPDWRWLAQWFPEPARRR
jgi:hypothetical protein